MRNLWSANLFRLKKSRLFRGILLGSFVFGVFMCGIRVHERQAYGVNVCLDSVFFGWSLLVGWVMAVFIPAFFGAEYSDGTLRSKVAAGHRRAAVYLVNLLTAFAAAMMFSAVYMLACILTGLPLIGGLTVSSRTVLWCVLGAAVTALAFCAVFLFITMLASRRSVSAVCVLLLTVGLFIGAIALDYRLNEPEYCLFVDIQGATVGEEPVRNPAYLSGRTRQVYEMLYDMTPAGQAIRYSNLELVHMERWVLYALGVTAVVTAAGAVLFQRKDLK